MRHRLRPAALDRQRGGHQDQAVRRIRCRSVTNGAKARTDKLKRLGLSAPKIKSIRAIGKAVAKGRIDLTAVGKMDADAAHAALTALHGVGPWTADIYLLFCLGHADACPAGDLAVQEAARIAFNLRKRPDAKALTKLAEAWRPWRGVAAHLLWAYYHAVKRREGMSLEPAAQTKKRAKAAKKKQGEARKGKSGMAEIDGPRIAPRSGTAKQLVVFLHGYGADGNDLIDIGRAWPGCCRMPPSWRRTRRVRAGRRRRGANGFR